MPDIIKKTALEQLKKDLDYAYNGGYEKGRSEGGYDEGYSNGYSEGEQFGYDQGYDQGYDEGHEQGIQDGAALGDEEAYSEGYNFGYSVGYDEGNEDGHSTGYDIGYEEGKDSMVDESKIIEKTASGKGIVALDDVSELPHDISVQLSSDTVTDFSATTVEVFNGNLRTLGTISFTTSRNYSFDQYLPAGKVYLSAVVTSSYTGSTKCILGVVDVNGKITYPTINKSINGERTIVTINAAAPVKSISFYAGSDGSNSSGQTATFANIMIASELAYVEPTIYTPTIDGKIDGIKSFSPYMTLMCDGVDMSVSYHKSYGMQTEYDRFWDAYQQNGNRTAYNYAFLHQGWNDYSYNPKYPIICVGSCEFAFGNNRITDTKVDIDLTQCSGTNGFFTSNNVLKTIRKLKVSENTEIASNMFGSCTALENLFIEGTIGQNINLQWSTKLSRASIDNIFGHLKKDYELTETNADEWEQDSETGAYPCDFLVVKLKEPLPDDVEKCFVQYEVGDNEGGGPYEAYFDSNGEARISFVGSPDNSGYARYLQCDYEYTVYEATACDTHTITLSKSAVNKAYETSEGANDGSTSPEWNALRAAHTTWIVELTN